jgi:hypothetical protein
MISLDVADLVVIAGALGTGTDAALGQFDVAAAQAALTEAQPGGHEPSAALHDRAVVAGAGIALVHALLRHRPFPRHGEQIAVAAGLQFLSLNGWQADLNPPATAVVVVEALASGQLSPDTAVAWLTPRLSRGPALGGRQAATRVQLPSLRPVRALLAAGVPAARMLVSAVLAIMVGGLALFATACSHGSPTPATHRDGQSSATRRSPEAEPARPAELAYAACMRSHGIENFPYTPASAAFVITMSTCIDVSSPPSRSPARR